MEAKFVPIVMTKAHILLGITPANAMDILRRR